MPINFVIVANSENRRVGFFQQAIERFGIAPATLVTYSDLIAGKDTLERFHAPDTIIRFDSPEKNFEVEKAIIAAGAEVQDGGQHQRISAAGAAALEFDKGRILYPRQWYLGWRHLLQQWQNQLGCPTIDVGNEFASYQALSACADFVETSERAKALCSHRLKPAIAVGSVATRVMNHPAEIAAMFDKPLCHHLFKSHGISVPRSLGTITCYDHLREQMQSQQCDRVFVKLSHGSSASGVVAYHANARLESAITTVERVRENNQTILYNSRKIRNYTKHEEVIDIINILCSEGVQVEEWLPKARMQNREFDVRVVVIDGQAQHIVVRLGNSPMTNLHLGSDRGDSEEFLSKVGTAAWEEMKRTGELAAALFPNSLYSGIDLLIRPDFQQHAILEINAFGDLLPAIAWNGIDTYTSEVAAILGGKEASTKVDFEQKLEPA